MYEVSLLYIVVQSIVNFKSAWMELAIRLFPSIMEAQGCTAPRWLNTVHGRLLDHRSTFKYI